MSLKNAVLLAFLGAVLLAIMLIVGFVENIWGVAGGFVPPVRFVVSLIETFAGITAAIFLYVFYRNQH
jgi:hypothetical protein